MRNGNVMTHLTHRTEWDPPLNQTTLNYLRQSIRKQVDMPNARKDLISSCTLYTKPTKNNKQKQCS